MSANIRPSGTFDTNYRDDIALNRTRTEKLLSYGWLVFLALVPLLLSWAPAAWGLGSWIGTINTIAIFTIAVVGLNILVGYTGLISLGHAAFMAVGAYSAVIYANYWGVSFWLALPMAAITTGIVGVLFGLPSLRVKGFYLGMATLAAQFIIPWVLRNPLSPWTNGANPLTIAAPPNFFGIVLDSHSEMYYVIVPLCVVLMLLARNISRTRPGRALISIRDNDLAAELLGINVFWYKLQAFAISSMYAGIAGALLAFNIGSIAIDSPFEGFFGLNNSIRMLGMLIIGGAGFALGPLFGVAFFKLMENYVVPSLTSPSVVDAVIAALPIVDRVSLISSVDPIFFGTILIIFLILEPRGLAYRWEIAQISFKIRPFSH
jgi:branched-chain amino acid transport system permease protein